MFLHITCAIVAINKPRYLNAPLSGKISMLNDELQVKLSILHYLFIKINNYDCKMLEV